METAAGCDNRLRPGPANVSTDFDGGGTLQIIEPDLKALSRHLSGLALSASLREAPAFIGLAGSDRTGPLPGGSACLRCSFERIRGSRTIRPAALQRCPGRSQRRGYRPLRHRVFLWHHRSRARMTFAGGWGPASSADEASAQWIGSGGSSDHASQAVDGSRRRKLRFHASELTWNDLQGFWRRHGYCALWRLRCNLWQSSAPSHPLVTSLRDRRRQPCRGPSYHGTEGAQRNWPESSHRSAGGRGLVICLTGGIGPHFEALPARQEMRDCHRRTDCWRTAETAP